MSLSIGSICPEIDFATSDARKTASAAMYFGSTSRLTFSILAGLAGLSEPAMALSPAMMV